MEIIQNIPVSIKFLLEGYPHKNRTMYPVYVQIIINRKKALVSLKMNADPNDWDFQHNEFKSNKQFNLVRNNRLRVIRENIVRIYSELKNSNLPVNVNVIKRILKGDSDQAPSMLFTDYYQQYIEELKKRPESHGEGVIEHYVKAQTHLLNFLRTSGWLDIKMNELSRKFIERFEHHLLTTPNPKRGKPMNGNTATTYIRKIKAAVNAALRKDVIQRDPFHGFKIKSFKNANKMVLTTEEIQTLINHDFAGNASLLRVRDIFIFSCYTGLRHSDALQLHTEMIKEDRDGTKWISLKQKKTGDIVEIPLSAQAVKIYNKYGEHRNLTGMVLPMISNQKINTTLKVIAGIAGLNKQISFHCARHTFATFSLELGIDLKTVSALMGHSSVKSTEVYGRITRKRKAEAIKLLNE